MFEHPPAKFNIILHYSMKVEIEKIGQTQNQEHFRIVTPFDIKKEEELRFQKEVVELIKDNTCLFEKGQIRPSLIHGFSMLKEIKFSRTSFIYI